MKLRNFHTQELGIGVKVGGLSQGKRFYVVTHKEWVCEHQHRTKADAGKCAKRRAYCVILRDSNLRLQYEDHFIDPNGTVLPE
jgi:hypothetical protein